MQTWRRCHNITKVFFAYIEVVLAFKLKGGYNQNGGEPVGLVRCIDL